MRWKRLKIGQEYVSGWQWRYIAIGKKSDWINGIGCVGNKYSGGNTGIEIRIPSEPQTV